MDINSVSEMLREADHVIIVPGYGMAVANAQHTICTLSTLLKDKGTTVKYGVHPVAGRKGGGGRSSTGCTLSQVGRGGEGLPGCVHVCAQVGGHVCVQECRWVGTVLLAEAA